MLEKVEGIVVTEICLYIFSNAYIADQYRLSRVPLKNRTQSHFCRTLIRSHWVITSKEKNDGQKQQTKARLVQEVFKGE